MAVNTELISQAVAYVRDHPAPYAECCDGDGNGDVQWPADHPLPPLADLAQEVATAAQGGAPLAAYTTLRSYVRALDALDDAPVRQLLGDRTPEELLELLVQYTPAQL